MHALLASWRGDLAGLLAGDRATNRDRPHGRGRAEPSR
jgi:hypothetical protein